MPTPPPSGSPHVLVADDQPDVLEALRLLLKGEGYAIDTAASPAAVLAARARRDDFDAVLIDLNYARDTTSGREGLDLLARAAGARSDPARGGDDRLGQRRGGGRGDAARRARLHQKPWDNARLLATLRTQVELGRALRQSRRLEGENRAAPRATARRS